MKFQKLKLPYSNDIPINKRKMLIRLFLISLSNLLGQYPLFIFYIIVNKIKNSNIESLMVFNMFFTFLFSKFVHKINYYRHHYLSFIIITIVMAFYGLIDIRKCIKDWETNLIYFILILIFCNASYAFENVIGKKALIEDYLSCHSILIYIGIFEIFLLFLSSIPFFFIKVNNEIIFNIFSRRLSSFKRFCFIFLLMIADFAYKYFLWIINDNFSPNHLTIILVFKGLAVKLYYLIFDTSEDSILISIFILIIYFVVFISTLINNEIIILNFCRLNENTKKNFYIKGEKDFEQSILGSRDESINFLEDKDKNENDQKEMELHDK